MRDAWESLDRADHRAREGRLRGAEERAARASRSRSAASRTRCSGRSCPSASPGRSPSCSATGPTGSRRSASATPPRWSARSRPRRCCSATAAARSSTSTEVERLIRRVAQLQNDLPQVSSLELSLVLAGAERRHRAHRRGPGRPGRRPALGLVRAPAADAPRGHPPGLSAGPDAVRDRLPTCAAAPPMTRTARSSCGRPSTAPATTPRSSPTASTAAVAGEEVVSFYVHHEPTFDRDEVRRHLTVVVLTPSRLILAHTDEHAGDDLLPEPYTSTSTEAIALSSVRSVVVTRMVANPTSGPTPAGRGRAHHRLGRGQPDRPRAGRLQRPRVRRRPRLHRRAGLRRLLAPGLGRRRRRRRRRRGCWPSPSRCPRGPTARERRRSSADFVEPAYGERSLGDVVPGGRPRRSASARPSDRRRPAWCCRTRRRTSCSSSTGSGAELLRALRPRRAVPLLAARPTRRPAPPACRRRPRPA